MILTDREIKMAIERGFLVIDPRPGERAFSSTSVDLTLDPTITEFKASAAGVEIVIDPALEGFDHDAAMDELTIQRSIDSQSGYSLPPKKLVLGWSAEYLDFHQAVRWLRVWRGKAPSAAWV